jgi:hypothetical protein
LLLELMNCDETAHVGMKQHQEENTIIKSDLLLDWMGEEKLLSHCAINQLSFNITLKRKELRVHIYYNTEEKT